MIVNMFLSRVRNSVYLAILVTIVCILVGEAYASGFVASAQKAGSNVSPAGICRVQWQGDPEFYYSSYVINSDFYYVWQDPTENGLCIPDWTNGWTVTDVAIWLWVDTAVTISMKSEVLRTNPSGCGDLTYLVRTGGPYEIELPDSGAWEVVLPLNQPTTFYEPFFAGVQFGDSIPPTGVGILSSNPALDPPLNCRVFNDWGQVDDLADVFGANVLLYSGGMQGSWGEDFRIQKTHNSIQGQHEFIDVTLESGIHEMGGFDFLIAYDASALGFQTAIPKPAFYEPAPVGCGWEYFTFRYGPTGNCGNQCPSGMLRVIGIAETNNGANHPDCFSPELLPATLFTLDFLVSNDRTFECQYIPIKWFWLDCSDNTVSSRTGDTLFISKTILDFDGNVVWNEEDDVLYPEISRISHLGAPDNCFANTSSDKPRPERALIFYHGGIDIVCADSIDDRGDINLNGVANEVADVVLFTNYFIYGVGVFTENVQGQIAATDVNADGLTLSVADLVYLIRIVIGDALPFSKLIPMLVNTDMKNGVLSVDAEMGAAYVVVSGNITPILLANDMEMKYAYNSEQNLTRILVFSMEKDQTFTGDFLSDLTGNIVTLEMATYEGVPVKAGLIPTEFALHQNYPNPFNPTTTITFAVPLPVEYELTIYNTLGRTVATFSGQAEPGIVKVDWDATDYSSGVYFYRLTAGTFTDKKKMTLIK